MTQSMFNKTIEPAKIILKLSLTCPVCGSSAVREQVGADTVRAMCSDLDCYWTQVVTDGKGGPGGPVTVKGWGEDAADPRRWIGQAGPVSARPRAIPKPKKKNRTPAGTRNKKPTEVGPVAAAALCTIATCGKARGFGGGRGYCPAHYKRWRAAGCPSDDRVLQWEQDQGSKPIGPARGRPARPKTRIEAREQPCAT